jgi:hypothetical protein
MDSARLIALFRKAGYAPRPYSGRGMFGRECLGVSLRVPASEFWADVIEHVSKADRAGVREVMREAREDTLGRGTILYFPRIQFEKA